MILTRCGEALTSQKFLFHTSPSLTGRVQTRTNPSIIFLPVLLSPLTVPPTNTNFIVQSHLHLSSGCSARLQRQEEGDTIGEDSFHCLDVAERGNRSHINNHHTEREIKIIPCWRDMEHAPGISVL